MTDVLGRVVADGDDPARRADAGPLRPHLHGRRQPRAHAVRHPPRAARLARALHRHPDRALRRRVPVLARARAGARPPGRRGAPRRRRGDRARRCATPASGSRSTSATRRSASGSATRSSRRSRRRSSSATASRGTSLAVRDRGGGQSTRRASSELRARACYAVSLPSRGAPFLTSEARRARRGFNRVARRGSRAAACSGFCRLTRRNGNSLVTAPLRPRRPASSPVARRPAGADQRPDPRPARPADRRGRHAARDQDIRRGARVRLREGARPRRGRRPGRSARGAGDGLRQVPYEQEQKAKLARKHQTQIHVKEIKLRPKIGVHDYETKKGHVERFLNQRAKVKVTIMFRGREHAAPGAWA